MIGFRKHALPLLCPDPSGDPISHSTSNPRVVIVDDRGTARSLLEGLVRSLEAGVVVDAFADPRDALAHLPTPVPDLVISDLRMPGMDGIELTRRIRSDPRLADVPIIIVSVVEDRQIRRQALETGANDFLTRPIDPLECRARCLNLLRLSHSRRQLEQQVLQASMELRSRERDTLMKLAMAGAYRNPRREQHLPRLAACSRLLAASLGLDAHECDDLAAAAPLHDIGMIGMPDHILLKPGLHSSEEKAILRRHPQIGHDLLADSPSPCLQLGAIVALGHHEKFDGSGYPQGLAGSRIPLPARIVAVADAFDSLTSGRPGETAWSFDNAFDYLHSQRGRHFDPECVQAFERRRAEVADVMRRLGDTPP